MKARKGLPFSGAQGRVVPAWGLALDGEASFSPPGPLLSELPPILWGWKLTTAGPDGSGLYSERVRQLWPQRMTKPVVFTGPGGGTWGPGGRGQNRGGWRPWPVLGFAGKGRHSGVNTRLARSSDFSGVWATGVFSAAGHPAGVVQAEECPLLGQGRWRMLGLAEGLAQVMGGSWWALGWWGGVWGVQMSEHHSRQKHRYIHTHRCVHT